MLAKIKPPLTDVLLAVVLTWLTVATLVNYVGWAQWPAYVLGGLTAAPIALRQRAPVATMAVVLCALAAYGLLGHGVFPSGGISVIVGLFTVATMRSRRVAAATWAVTTALVVVGSATASVVWSEVLQAVVVLLCTWAVGDSTRRWAKRAERLAEEAAQAAARERVRIARELHDIVAHHMSVISMQAGVAQYVLDADLPTARNAIATVGDTSREALQELRRLLDVLRVDHSADSDSDADYSPQPGLAVLDELVERTRNAGLPVEVVITGTPRALPPGPDLCAYRIAQESLTNVLKHAGPARARVDLDYGERMLTLKVTDDGPRSTAHPPSQTSYGIRGMRERIELYGGDLTAGPSEGGGFSVVARLPMGEVS